MDLCDRYSFSHPKPVGICSILLDNSHSLIKCETDLFYCSNLRDGHALLLSKPPSQLVRYAKRTCFFIKLLFHFLTFAY